MQDNHKKYDLYNNILSIHTGKFPKEIQELCMHVTSIYNPILNGNIMPDILVLPFLLGCLIVVADLSVPPSVRLSLSL